jgi:hypothetical protein
LKAPVLFLGMPSEGDDAPLGCIRMEWFHQSSSDLEEAERRVLLDFADAARSAADYEPERAGIASRTLRFVVSRSTPQCSYGGTVERRLILDLVYRVVEHGEGTVGGRVPAAASEHMHHGDLGRVVVWVVGAVAQRLNTDLGCFCMSSGENPKAAADAPHVVTDPHAAFG